MQHHKAYACPALIEMKATVFSRGPMPRLRHLMPFLHQGGRMVVQLPDVDRTNMGRVKTGFGRRGWHVITAWGRRQQQYLTRKSGTRGA